MSDILWPLAGCSSADPLHGGYGWLDVSADGVTPHCGIDLNAGAGPQSDCGAAIVAPCDMTVVRAITGVQNGYGNHIWALADRSNKYLHFCHLDRIVLGEGTHLSKGSVFASCGRSNGWANGWPFCHLHFEVRHQAPPNWEFWPKGYSRTGIATLYLDPEQWLTDEAQQQSVVIPPVPAGESDEMALTDDQRAVLDKLSALGAGADSIDKWLSRLGRGAEIGRELVATKRLSAKRYRALANELTHLAD